MTDNAEHEVTAGTVENAIVFGGGTLPEGEPDFPRFTVDVKPHTRGKLKGKYDIFVNDINGNLLVSSFQGYENRAFAEKLAVRLFGSAMVIASVLGIEPAELRKAEPAKLNIWGADGSLDKSYELR